MNSFDADALLAALPRRAIRHYAVYAPVRSSSRRPMAGESALFQAGAYNGFSGRERSRTAALSNWLAKVGCTERPGTCDICGAPAQDEHAEHFYDLACWIGLCCRCHRSALHNRIAKSVRWEALLDQYEVGNDHRSRLVPSEPFDLAALLRARGWREPVKADYTLIATSSG